MNRLSRLVLDHKLLVVCFWLAVLLAGLFATSVVGGRLSEQFTFPGQPGYEANEQILNRYNGTGGPGDPLVPVITLPPATTAPETRGDLTRAFERLDADPRLRAVSYPSTGDEAFVGDGGRTVFGLVFVPFTGEAEGPDLAPEVGDALSGALPEGATVRVTGLSELAAEAAEGGGDGAVLLETLVAAAGALIVLAVVFGSLLAVVPLLVAAVSILATFLAVLGLTTFTDVSFIVQFLIALIGLGVAIDYSLLLVTRWREERSAGRDRHEAVHVAMATAGRSVVFSGLTVAIALLVLVVVPVPFIRSVGYAGVLIPALSVLVTLTLLPVLLASAGPRLDWPRRRTERRAGRVWTRWATQVVRHRWLATLGALALLAPLIVATSQLRLGSAPSEALPGTGPARAALESLNAAGVPSGVLTPIEVLVPAGADPAALADRLGDVSGVYAAVPAGDRSGASLVEVLPAAETSTDAGRDTVQRVREVVSAELPGAAVGGSGALLIDAIDAIYGNFILILAVIAAATFALLARAFRSLVLAAQAVVVNLLSIAAAYGAAVLIWQEGYGSGLLFDYDALGAITFWVPLMTFAFLYGLSMDYEVFLLSRMRETYDESGSTVAASVEGLGRVGRLVTSAALILFLAFVSLSAVPAVDVKVMATTLGIGILLDATVVRALLVPALVAVSGRWTWWLPAWAARPLRARPSPPAPAGSPAPPQDLGAHDPPAERHAPTTGTGAPATRGARRGIPNRTGGARSLGIRLRAIAVRIAYDTLYLTSGLATAILGLVVWTVAVTVFASLAVFVVGLAAIPLGAIAFRWTADLDRRRAALVLAHPLRGSYRDHRGERVLDRLAATLRDPQTWRDLTWLVVHSVVGIAFGSAAISLVAGVLGQALLPAWSWAVPDGVDAGIWTIDTVWEALLAAPLAIPLAAVAVVLLRGMARGSALLAAALLGSREQTRPTGSRWRAGRRLRMLLRGRST